MKIYAVAYNHYWKTASLHLEEIPAPLYFLREGVMTLCGILPGIPLPSWIWFRLKNRDDQKWSDNHDGWVNLQDWFGDTQQLFHLFVCTPVYNLVHRYTKTRFLNFPYEFLKERFPEEFTNPEYEFDYAPGEREAIEAAVSEINIQFRESYDLLGYDAIQKRIKYAK